MAKRLGPPYPFPPIIEAVVEFRFEEALSEADLAKMSKRLASAYPNEQVQMGKSFKVDLQNSTTAVEDEGKRYRRTNDDQNEIVLFGGHSLVISQLAVYPSWGHLHGRIAFVRGIWRKALRFRKISQIGMRYINRIDIPAETDNLVHHEKYMNLKINMPPEHPHTIAYSLSFQIPLPDIKCVANVNSASTESPVPMHGAFTLDIDLVRVVDVPQRDADIDNLLEQMRSAKNELFESFILDPAREKFFHEQPLRQLGT